MGESPEESIFYQFLKSDEGPETNSAGYFINYVPGKVFRKEDHWVVGISSISFPDSFYNIHGKIRRITIGNNLSELNFEIPAGRYSPQGFVSVLNKIARRKVMPQKYDILHKRGMSAPLSDEDRIFQNLKLDLGEINTSAAPVFVSEKEKQEFESLFSKLEQKTEWTYHDDVEEGGDTSEIAGNQSADTLLEVPESQKKEFRKLLKAYCTAGRTGAVLDFRLIDTGEENGPYEGERPILRTINDYTLRDFTNFLTYHSRTLNEEHPVRNLQEFMRTSKLEFFYDSMYKKIGVRCLFEENPFGDYFIVHHPLLRNMIGMHEEDAKALKDNRTKGWLGKKGARRFRLTCNFEIVLENIFVYCNIVTESGVGDQKARICEILSVPTINPEKRSQLSFNFPIPNYKSVDRTLVNCIEIFLADSMGKKLKFHDWGLTIVSLKFKKIKTVASLLERIFNLMKNFISNYLSTDVKIHY